MTETIQALVTIGQVKSFLDVLTTDYDALFTEAIHFVSSEIQCICNQSIASIDTSISFQGNNKNFKMLPNFPVNNINNITCRTSPLGSLYTLDAAYYTLDCSLGYRVYYQNQFSEDTIYTVSYNYGWNPIPQKIQQIAVEGVAKIFKESNKNDKRFGLQSISAGIQGTNESTTFKDLYKEWEQRLITWKKYGV